MLRRESNRCVLRLNSVINFTDSKCKWTGKIKNEVMKKKWKRGNENVADKGQKEYISTNLKK